ncbi:MAG: T9SS type A sorting domain-containing protein [Fibrobacteres bacterium]|nr:T9SS type A sorting domain-containing protein [Fibrobacterota bacterium]
MVKKYCAITLFLAFTVLFSDPATQAVNTWEFQYRRANIDHVTHVYENGFVWDSKNDVGLTFGGHLGTYYGQPEAEFINVKNTNMSYLFSFSNKEFKMAQPALRPPKRCGAKTIYDDSWNHFLAIGGGAEQFDFAYYEPSPTLSVLVKEGSRSTLVPRTLAPWAFNAETGQWYAMRPLHHSAPPAYAPHGGWGSNYCFATEYGLALLAPTNAGRVHAYSAYSNQWTLLPANSSSTITPVQENDICAAYDLKNRRMVWLNANTASDSNLKTWSYDIGTKEWELTSTEVKPTKSSPEWFFGYGSIAYDRKNAAIVYLHSSGTETWVLYSDSSSWVKKGNVTYPPSSGNMGEGLTYDENRNAILAFVNKNDEVWSYKTGSGIAGRPNPPISVSAVTTATGIDISWQAPKSGTTPIRYRIFRAAWDDNKSNGSGIVPYSYILIDSTSGTTFIDNDDTLKTVETFHSYYIEAVSQSGQVSDPSTPVYTRLRVPFGLTATAFASNHVVLSWKPKKESDLAGYNIYRYQKAYPYTRQMLSKRINTSLLAEPFFVDTTVRLCGSQTCPDSLAMYCVTAVNKLGKESGLSPFATTAPDWPTNIWADTARKLIHWSPPRNGNIQEYRIYEGIQYARETGTPDVSLCASTADTFWSYAHHVSPKCYKVRAFSRMGQLGHFSDVMAIQTKDSVGFGNHKLDFQAERPPSDQFYDDVPRIAAERNSGVLRQEELFCASPNPFNPFVKIIFQTPLSLKERAFVSIYAANGRMIDKIALSAVGSRHIATWDASKYPSGIYAASLSAGNISKSIKLVLTK